MDRQDVNGTGNVALFPKVNKRSVPGMSPAFVLEWDKLADGIHDVVEKAIAAELPPQLIMGQLRHPDTVAVPVTGWSDELVKDWRHMAERLQMTIARASLAGIPFVLITGQLEGAVADILDCMMIEVMPV